MKRRSKRNVLIVIVAVLVIVIISACKFTYGGKSPSTGWITADERSNFLYGSVGAEREAGIPYWIWLALPRMFPEYMPGNGGYVSLGFSWEEGKEMPAGFSKKTVGYRSRSRELRFVPRRFFPQRTGRRARSSAHCSWTRHGRSGIAHILSAMCSRPALQRHRDHGRDQ